MEVIIGQNVSSENLTIIGNWFAAESTTPRPGGYSQTVFQWHALTVSNYISKFDLEFEENCRALKIKPEDSLNNTIIELKKIIDENMSPAFNTVYYTILEMEGKKEGKKNNDDLIKEPNKWNESLFITTKKPKVWPKQKTRAAKLIIEVDKQDKAAVLDKKHSLFSSEQPTINQIRKGNGDLWLLSGGTLIFDEKGRIALGLRDSNAADPFVFTNIGAGRCDQKMEAHCIDEMASEFLLCVKREKEDPWQQVWFGSATRSMNVELTKTRNVNSRRSMFRLQVEKANIIHRQHYDPPAMPQHQLV